MLAEKIFRRAATDTYLIMDPEKFPRLRAFTRRSFGFLVLAAFSLPAALRGDQCFGEDDCPGECPLYCCEGASCVSSCVTYNGACPSGSSCWTTVNLIRCCDCRNVSDGSFCTCSEHGDLPLQ